MKNERGITLMVLIITIVIMIILVATGIEHGSTSISEVKLQNFSYELQQIQGKVNTIHEKMLMEKDTEFVTLADKTIGKNITLQGLGEARATLSKVKPSFDYENITEANRDKLYANQYETIFRYFSAKDLEDVLDIKNAKLDVIINFETREVISVSGQTHNDEIYYRLEDF